MGVVVHSYPYTSRALIDIAGRHHLQVSDALYFHPAKSYGLPELRRWVADRLPGR